MVSRVYVSEPGYGAARGSQRASRRLRELHTAWTLFCLPAVVLVLTSCVGSPAGERSAGPAPLAGDSASVTAGAAPSGDEERAASLPPIPYVDGPLHLRVSYPRSGVPISTRERNFIFGSTGSGDARVWINGTEVEVQPNGGFLGFLPVPQDGVYQLRATLDGAEETLQVEVPIPAPPPSGDLVIDVSSISPRGGWIAQPGERIQVSFRGTPGGRAALVFGDTARVPLVESAPAAEGATDFEVIRPGGAEAGKHAAGDGLVPYRGFFTARRIVSADTTVPWPSLASLARPAPDTRSVAEIELAMEDTTVRRPLPLNMLLADPGRPRVGEGLDPRPPASNGDGRVIGRPGPGGGPYHYIWLNGTELEITGEREGAFRIRLTDHLSGWTPSWQVVLQPPGIAPPEARITTVRMAPAPGHVDVHVAMDRPLPYRVEEGERSMSLFVYGGTSRVNFLQSGELDPYVVAGEWSQSSDRLFRLDLHFSGPAWGYDTFRSEAGDLVLRLRRPPEIDPVAPLRGLTIGVDAGHGGEDRETMGPTGLTEADANLGIALELRDQLGARGARVVMTRTTDTTLSPVERTRIALEENVDVWISVHNNAFPDGIDPWVNSGTVVYYNHANSAELARAVQRELLAELRLRDLGVGRADLHQVRFTWAPAILSENAFMMIPEHEALLKTEEGRRRIARAHVRGLEAWLARRAGDGR